MNTENLKKFIIENDSKAVVFGYDKMIEYGANKGKLDRERLVEFFKTNKIGKENMAANVKPIEEFLADEIFSNRNYARLWVALSLKRQLNVENLLSAESCEKALLATWVQNFNEIELSYNSKNYEAEHLKIIKSPQNCRFEIFKELFNIKNKIPLDATPYQVYVLKDDNFIYIVDTSEYTKYTDAEGKTRKVFGNYSTMIIEKDFPQYMDHHYFIKRTIRMK